MKQTIESLVDGGKASAGPPLGPALGPMKVNIGQVVAAINEKTKDFAGMKVPIKVIIDDKTKEFEIQVGTPPVSALIKKELGIAKGSGEPNSNYVGDLTIDQAKKIARMKTSAMLGATPKARVLEVLGAATSMGVKFEGMPPKEAQKAIAQGKFDDKLKDE